ncbi:hypothetical protein LR68_01738 [Anoxybacillus sp. BCO1]|nr:hypothetical protein LR68_01738 [Anoxybacillus sp. BCO1]
MAELLDEQELAVYGVDLAILLEFLVEKHILSVEKIATKGQGVFHRHYMVEKNKEKVLTFKNVRDIFLIVAAEM